VQIIVAIKYLHNSYSGAVVIVIVW